MNEDLIYEKLSLILKDKDNWKDYVDEVAEFLNDSSLRIRAKALWIIASIGLKYPDSVKPYIDTIANNLTNDEWLIRSRAINALGRIGRADFELIRVHFEKMFELAKDKEAEVRLSFIWASENIATNYPTLYEEYMDLYADFMNDDYDRIRMEAPEMFRVLGSREPKYVLPYLDKLKYNAENDINKVVRIHSNGAIKATYRKLKELY